MNATTKTATNEVILKEVRDMAQNLQDFMQMTSEGLDRVDRTVENLVERVDGVEGELGSLNGEMKDLKQASYRHELQITELTRLVQSTHDEQLNMHADINEILHRVLALEERSKLTKAELHELQSKLQKLVDWAKAVAQKEGIPLKLS